jgi:hypothetical protein
MSNPTVSVTAFGSPALQAMLIRHPLTVIKGFEETPDMRIEFAGQSRHRIAYRGNDGVSGPYGLTELMDNNPLVCADVASVTGGGASLALIALGPLAKAELLLERPAIALNFNEPHSEEIDAALTTEGWKAGASIATSDDDPEIYSAQCIAEIRMPGHAGDIDDLFDECFGRSFFVRPSAALPAPNDPHATYSISINDHGDGTGLATVHANSARDAKTGAGALVHFFNVMCGFEESLGVAGTAAASAEI